MNRHTYVTGKYFLQSVAGSNNDTLVCVGKCSPISSAYWDCTRQWHCSPPSSCSSAGWRGAIPDSCASSTRFPDRKEFPSSATFSTCSSLPIKQVCAEILEICLRSVGSLWERFDDFPLLCRRIGRVPAHRLHRLGPEIWRDLSRLGWPSSYRLHRFSGAHGGAYCCCSYYF